MAPDSGYNSTGISRLPESSTAEAGNPFVSGWYADPSSIVYNGRVWVFPSVSCSRQQQSYLDAFSSSDLIHWTKHAKILHLDNINWAVAGLSRPSPISRNGKFYLYFSADFDNDRGPSRLGGVGVAVADRPEGPYTEPLGHPLIRGGMFNTQPIHVDVVADEVDQAVYIYYGGDSALYVAKLNDDMVSVSIDDVRDITPRGFGDGPRMIQYEGNYYLSWAEKAQDGHASRISYAVSATPTGPFYNTSTLLEDDGAVAKGIGRHSFVRLYRTDVWYIFYDRQSLSETESLHRGLAYDRVYFNKDGTIQPVTMLVKDNFADGQMLAWSTYGGEWSVEGQRLTSQETSGGMALLDTNFADFMFDATIQPTKGTGHPGLLFRVSNLDKTTYKYKGYKAALSPLGTITLGKADMGTFTDLAQVRISVVPGAENHVRVTAVGSRLRIYVNDMTTPRLEATDKSFTTGANGVRVYNVAAKFGNVSIRKFDGSTDDAQSLPNRDVDKMSDTDSEDFVLEKRVVDAEVSTDPSCSAIAFCGLDQLFRSKKRV